MPIHDPSPEEARRLAVGEFGHAFSHVAPMYATVLFWNGPGSEEFHNGTTFFLDCGRGTFGVTAGHVFDRLAVDAEHGARCQIGGSGQRFDLRERLIARGKRVDIATYHVAQTELPLIGATVLTGWQREWPPKAPQVDRGVLFAGFPGVDRQVVGRRQVEFSVFSGSGVASSVSDRDISCVIEREFLVPSADWPTAPVDHDLAGMSGGPMLAVVQSEVVGWRLAGVIYECGRGLLEMVKAVRADFIRQDGTLED